MIGSGFWASGRLFGAIWQAGKLNQRRSRGVAWPNTRPCQGRERRFESGRDRHLKPLASSFELRSAVAVRRGGRAVEGGGLENRYRVLPYRGFESHPLRHCHVSGHTGPISHGGPPNFSSDQAPSSEAWHEVRRIRKRPSDG